MLELSAQQQQLLRRMEKLRHRLDAISVLEELRRHPYSPMDIDAECIVSFKLIEKEKLRQYIENPYLYSRVQHSDHLQQEQRGLTILTQQIDQFPPAQILWRKNSSTYIVCLLKEEITEEFPNDLNEHLAYIQHFYRTGAVISRFLLCAQEDGKVYDFYKTFVEIIL